MPATIMTTASAEGCSRPTCTETHAGVRNDGHGNGGGANQLEESFRHDEENASLITTISEEVNNMTKKLFSIRDCAKTVGVAPHRITYAHVQGRLPEPELWVFGKRLYTEADVKRVAEYFQVKKKPKETTHER
jgi:hypothetical protein